MSRHICKYFLVDGEGIRRCSQCGQPAHAEGTIEVKAGDKIFPPESSRLKRAVETGRRGIESKLKG